MHKPLLALILAGIPILAVPRGAAAARAQEDHPVLAAHRTATPAVDGRLDFPPTSPWMPVLRVEWQQGEARADAWFRADWSPRGLYVSVVLPHARAADRMETGRTPQAPFVLHLGFESGKGPCEIRCVPLVAPVSRMTMRHHSYLS